MTRQQVIFELNDDTEWQKTPSGTYLANSKQHGLLRIPCTAVVNQIDGPDAALSYLELSDRWNKAEDGKKLVQDAYANTVKALCEVRMQLAEEKKAGKIMLQQLAEERRQRHEAERCAARSAEANMKSISAIVTLLDRDTRRLDGDS